MPLRNPFQVLWNPSHELGAGVSLDKLTIKEGPWEYNNVFRDLFVAYEWGICPPSDFWKHSRVDQELMIAYISARNDMTAYEEDSKPKPEPVKPQQYNSRRMAHA